MAGRDSGKGESPLVQRTVRERGDPLAVVLGGSIRHPRTHDRIGRTDVAEGLERASTGNIAVVGRSVNDHLYG